MCIVLKLIIESDDDSRVVNEREILRIERSVESTMAPIGLGLTLLEAKTMLAAAQKEVVALQAEQIVTQASHCTDCGAVLKIKDTRQLVYRTLLGKLRLRSPRMLTCACQAGSSIRSFSPLANALTERPHPALQYLTTRWASIMSYGASSVLLDEILPIGAAMSCSSIRNAVLRVGQRMDAKTATPEGAPAGIERTKLPRAHRVDCDHPLAIELDAGYICSNDRSEKGSRWFSATVARLVGT